MDEEAKALISDLTPGLKHHSIHCISFVDGMSTVIGMDMDEFSNLFLSLKGALQESFQHSPLTLGKDEVSCFSSIRFKLFVTLYRAKVCEMHHLFIYTI